MEEEKYPEDEEDMDMKERNVYKKEILDELVEDDEISAEEEAFMQGYDDAAKD